MDVSDVLSIFAIIVSFGCFIFEAYNSKKINRINLENKYYEKIFDDIILYKIPQARKYFFYSKDSGKFEGTKKLQGVLVKLMKDSLFFYYKNKEFYNELSSTIKEIEEYLINSEGDMSLEEYSKFESEIEKKIEDLYTLISNYSVC